MLKKLLPVILAGTLLVSVSATAAPSAWAQAEVNAAIEVKIVPEKLQDAYQNAVTREEFCEMAMLLWKQLSGKEIPEAVSTFADTQNPSVAAAQSLGIVQGESPTQFSPNNPVTRQEMSVMLQNVLKSACPALALPETYANTFPDREVIADWAIEAVQCMNLFAVMLGDENGNINPLGNTTREQSILLTYRLLQSQIMSMQEYVEKFLMPVNGNTHDNMLGGAFTVCTAEGKTYYVSESGIYELGSETPVVEKAAKSVVAIGNTMYYIGADNGIYMVNLTTKEEKKIVNDETDSFSAYDGAIFYRNLSDGGKIYRMELATLAPVAITETAGELLVISGNGKFFTDGEAIYKFADDYTKQLVYSGKNKHLCVRNNKFYFINASGQLCSADLNGANYSVVSKLPVKSFCFTRDCLIGLGQEDSAVYKIDYSGRYAIKMDTSTYVNINTYDDYVYARDAEGGIYKISNNATEKARIN